MSNIVKTGRLSKPGGYRRVLCTSVGAVVIGCLCFGGTTKVCGQGGGADDLRTVGLRIDAVHPDASSTVTFTVSYVASYPYTSVPEDSLDVNMADETYRAKIDRQSMGTLKGRFTFRIYVNRSASFERTVFVYEVGEDTTDTFNDAEKTVNFRVGPEGNSVLGTAALPMHSPFGPPTALVYKDKDGKISTPPLQPVSIGGNAPFSLTLDNELTNLKATLGNPLVSADCADCWKVIPAAKISQTTINPGDRVTVSFAVTASTLRAMRASAIQIGPDKSNDTLRVSIPVTAEGGTMRPQVFTVPIRFTPPLTEMVITDYPRSVPRGALRKYFAPAPKQADGNVLGKRETDGTIKDFVTGLVIALVCEGLAVVLFVETNTEVKLIGVSLDPTQLVPAFLICTLIGGGTVVITAIKNALGLGGGK